MYCRTLHERTQEDQPRAGGLERDRIVDQPNRVAMQPTNRIDLAQRHLGRMEARIQCARSEERTNRVRKLAERAAAERIRRFDDTEQVVAEVSSGVALDGAASGGKRLLVPDCLRY